jgi:hypothetical protein
VNQETEAALMTRDPRQSRENFGRFAALCKPCQCSYRYVHASYRHCPKCGHANPEFNATELDRLDNDTHAIGRGGLNCPDHTSRGYQLGIEYLDWERCIHCAEPIRANPAQQERAA